MSNQNLSRAGAFEAAVVTLGVGLLGGAFALALGKMLEAWHHQRQHADPVPADGTIPDWRHHNSSASPR